MASKEEMPHGFVEHLVNLMSKLDNVIKSRAISQEPSDNEDKATDTEDKMSELDKAVVYILWSAVLVHPEYTNGMVYPLFLRPCESNSLIYLQLLQRGC